MWFKQNRPVGVLAARGLCRCAGFSLSRFFFFCCKKLYCFHMVQGLREGSRVLKKLPSSCREGLQAALMLGGFFNGHWSPEAPSRAWGWAFRRVTGSGRCSLAAVCVGASSRWLLVLQRPGSRTRGLRCFHHVGSVVTAPWLGCSETCGICPDRTHVPCIGRWIPYHWATSEAPNLYIHPRKREKW